MHTHRPPRHAARRRAPNLAVASPLRRSLIFAVLLLALTAGSVIALTAWRSGTTSRPHEGALRDLIVAEHRRVCGTTLSVDTRLVWLARYRATDMVLNGYFSHTTLTGKKVWSFLATSRVTYQTAAEILAWNSYSDDLSPKEAYRDFMASAGHRSAIRACAYTRIGVGDFKAGGKRMYAVLFIRP